MQTANSMLTNPRFSTRGAPAAISSEWPWTEIIVAGLLALCVVLLTHDPANLSAGAEESVEAGRGLEDSEKFEKDVNAAPLHRKFGFLMLLALGAYCVITAPRNTRLMNYGVVLMLVVCSTWLTSSFLWSDDWRHSAREFVRIGAFAFVALGMALRFRQRQVCLVIMLTLLGSVATAFSACVLTGNFRPWEGDFRLQGTLHSNLLSHHALGALLVAVALLPSARKMWFWRLVILSMFTIIVLTKTRGALASSLVGITAIKLIGRPLWSNAVIVSVLGSVAMAFALLVTMAGPQVQDRLGSMLVLGRSEGVTTLTGRIPLWKAVLHESRHQRWQGYGYGGFWSTDRTEKLAKRLQWYPRHSHSAYVHTMLDLGYVGLALLLLLVLACLVAAFRSYRFTGDPAYTFFFGFLFAGLIDGFVEVCYVSPRELGLYVGISMMSLIIAHSDSSTQSLGNDLD